MNKLMLTAAAFVAAASVANASSNFGGFYAGLMTGADMSKFSITPKADGAKEKSKTGILYGLFGGWGHSFSNNLYLGVEMDVTGSSAKPTIEGTDGEGAHKAQGKLKFSMSVAPRVGYAFGNALAYAKVGLGMAKFSATSYLNNVKVGSASTDSKFVMTPGLGLDYKFGSNIIARVGYDCFLYSKKEDGVKVKYTGHRFVLGAAYQF